MNNILQPNDAQTIKLRIAALKADTQGLWGKMNVSQMICHCSDQLRVLLGELSAQDRGSFLHKTLVKFLVLYVIKAPKGKVQTAPELAAEYGGSKPTEFEQDRAALLALIDKFLANPHVKVHPHPTFGKLSRKQWGRLVFLHLDHHLSQFGV